MARNELGRIRVGVLHRPGLEFGDLLIVQPVGRVPGDILEHVVHHPAGRIPVGDDAGLGPALGIPEGLGAVDAAHAGVARGGRCVIAEVGQVDAAEGAELAVLLEGIRGETARVDPLLDACLSVPGIDTQRQDAVDAQPGRCLLHVVALNRGVAVGAAHRGQRPGEDGAPTAALTDDLLVPGEPGLGVRLLRRQLGHRRRQLPLGDPGRFGHSGIDRDDAAAVRAFQRLGRGIEGQHAATVRAWIGAGLLGDLEDRRISGALIVRRWLPGRIGSRGPRAPTAVARRWWPARE